MAGHSKWKNIKHKKAASDAQKAKVYTKLIKDITVSARTSGGDTANNSNLRMLLEKARKANMPQENAIRAIKKGTGELPGVHYEPHQYEGYGPNGIAVIVEVLTENKNRAIAEVRAVFTRKGGSIAETGAVNWMFERKGVVRGKQGSSAKAALTEDILLEALIDYDVSDISSDTSSSETLWTITCEPKDLEKVKEALLKIGFDIDEAELEWVAKESLELPEDKQEAAIEFLEALEELEDVQNVYSNLA